jgi:acetyl-CoA carboxylase biotin carboxyl carrier protein
MIDLKTLKSLIKLMIDNGLTELDVEHEGAKVRLARGVSGPTVTHLPATAPPPVAAGSTPAAGLPAAEPANGPAGQTINSPMVGTFYSSPNPDAEPFVAVGNAVEPDTVVCIIEAMKVFNEVKSDLAGTIEKVLVQNGQAVEFGQPLFIVKPT